VKFWNINPDSLPHPPTPKISPQKNDVKNRMAEMRYKSASYKQEKPTDMPKITQKPSCVVLVM